MPGDVEQLREYYYETLGGGKLDKPLKFTHTHTLSLTHTHPLTSQAPAPAPDQECPYAP